MPLSAPSPQDRYAQARFNMVESQIRPNRVTDDRLLAAFSELQRETFVPPALASVAYVDQALPVAPGRYLQEPLFLARLLQEASVRPEDRTLVIGAGTGYSAAILACLAASVTAVESEPELAARAEANLARLALNNARIEIGPLAQGWPGAEPYDLILIEGAVADLPQSIADQLAEQGRLVTIRAGRTPPAAGMLYRKIGGRVSGRVLFDAAGAFLPGFEPRPVFAL
jgi:protein-L-isoaspartate(D-aspartate) O-methyltransferase